VRLDVRHRLKPTSSSAELLARHAWKLGLGVVVAALLTTRGVTEAPVHLSDRSLAAGGGPTVVPCGALPAGTTIWNTAGSPYILPINTTNDPIPNDPNACPAFPAAGQPQPATPPGVVVLPGSTLEIDAGQGPVQIFSHGSGITVDGGELRTINTSAVPPNFVSFDAEPDVASWDGISIIASDSNHRGNGSLAYTSIAHALTSITITSGAVATDDPLGSGSQVPYGLGLANVAIGPSYFDGIDATDTPISFVGQADAGGLATGLYGTVNNIGSQGIKVGFDSSAPSIPAKALQIKAVTFGSSVPFGETSCLPLQPCAAGSIGNDAIQGFFTQGQQEPIELSGNRFFRAGSFGLELTNANNPMITDNIFTCNGSGSAKPVISCVGSGLRYSAIFLSSVTNLNIGASGLNSNKGQQNGLDAIVLNGQVVSDLPWLTPFNDPNPSTVPPLPPNPPHTLGYIVAGGDLQLVNSKLTVKDGDVVKVKGGAILISNGSLDAGSAGLKTFTSLRDNTIGIQACPSVFVQSCPSPLPANEWIGLNLVGSTGNIANASILFPTKAIDISAGQASLIGPDGGSYGLVVTNSRLGPTFSDSVAVNATPVYISASKFCRIDTIPTDLTYLQCAGAGPGDHGINASYTGTPRPAAGGGLKLLGNDFQGSTNEAILGTALGGRVVDIENDTVEAAGTYGMHLASADNLTLKGNGITGSGIGNLANTTTYPAIYLDGISKADFSGSISANSGTGNGLDAIAFHGSTADAKPLNWKTVGATGGALGYIVDGDLAVNGDLTLFANDYAPVLGGAITLHNGTLSSSGAVLSSLKEQTPHLPSCGSVFIPKISGVCPVAAPGDWTGLILDPGMPNKLTNSEIRYAAKGISVGTPTGSRSAQNLTLIGTNVRNTAFDGVATQSPVSITGGAFSGNGGRGIAVDLTGVSPSAAQPLVINGHTSVSGSGQDGILAIVLSGHSVTITGVSVDRAGALGINLQNADNLTLTNNTVTNSAATYPAIYLNGFTGAFGTIHGNTGAGNGIDAIAFHGTVTDSLTWQTARKTSDPTQPLGYVLDNTLNMQAGNTLTVKAGDIVKVGNDGLLNLQGASLAADDTASSGQKTFTSLADNTIGVMACPSVLLQGCRGAASGDWGGISLSGAGANGALVNAAVRYASTGIAISSGAVSTYGSSTFGLVIARSTIGPTSSDGIVSTTTPISVTDSTVSDAIHGINVDLTGAPPNTALRVSGNRFHATGAEAVLGQALAGQPVWITDNHVLGAGTFGIRLLNADQLVLRNNNISGSGGGPNAGAGRYPAVYLNGISADFTRNVRGNVGSGNGLDVIAFHGTASGDLSWQTPTVNAVTAALGYVLDGSLTVNDGTLTVHSGDVVKSIGGPITVVGGTLDASNTSNPATKLFTSLKDQTAYPQTCPSILTGLCASGPEQGDWGGIVITDDTSGRPGSASVANGQLSFAATALTIDSGPTASFGTTSLGLIVKGTTISDTTGDGINAQDTPSSVTTSTIQRVGVHGILATFFGGTPCVTACGTSLDVEHVTITKVAKDGIVASGLGGRHTVVSNNVITGAGTYGIRLAGADQLTLNNNTVNSSGGPATTFRYPAIYLSGVKADFELAPGTTTVAANHGSGNGLDAMVIHGEASQALTWLTTGVTAPVAVPPVPIDHFGYMMDGGLTVDGALTTNIGDVVKVLGGLIQVNGSLQASGTTFTSLKDGALSIRVCDAGYDSVFLQKVSGSCPAAASGDWAGIKATAASMLTNTTIGFDDGLRVTSGGLYFAGGAMHDIAADAIVVSGSPPSVTNVTNVVFSRVGNDAIDSTNSGSADTITDDQFDHIGGVAINLQNAQADLERNVFTNDASPAVKTSGAPVTLACSSIQSGGVSGDAGLVVKESDFVATVGVTAPAGASAENNWWGQATGPNGQLSGGLTVTSYFVTQNPSATIAITGKPSATQTLDPVNADLSLGTGLAQATLTFSRNMNPEAALPSVSYASTPVGFTGAWKLNDPRTWIGTAPIDSSLATTGTHTVSASGAHDCVPDLLHNLMTPASNTFAADTTTMPAVSVGAPDLLGANSARLHGHIDPAGWATGADQFVLTNLASPFDLHTYPAPAVADKTTPLDFSLVATGLSQSSTYSVQLQVPSVNGTATQSTLDTVTTTAPASKLVFTSSPPLSIAAGAPFSVTASAEDSSANVVSDFTGSVTIVLTPATATLSGTLMQSVVNGVASFSALSVNKTGTYTLTATSTPSLTAALSSSFTILPATATHLVFTTQPGSTATAGSPLAQQPVVSIEDSLNNVVTTDNTTSVTLALTTPNGATLGGTTTQTASSGVASFTNLNVDKTGSYTFTATSTPSLTSPLSSSFSIQPGTATQLVFTTQPSSTATAGVAFTQQPVVSVEDNLSNVVTTDNTTSVMLALTTPNGATLAGTTSQSAASGVASFSGLSVNKTGSYTFTATSTPSLTSALSSGFTIQPGTATQLVFSTQPSSTATAGVAFAQQPVVSVQDAGGNVVTTDNATSVMLALTTPNGATLAGTTSQTASGGVASFTNLSVDKTGSYTFTATSTPSLTSALSSGFTIQPGTATQLVFLQQPTSAQSTVAIAPAVTAAIEDSFGNVVTSNTSTITVSLASSTPPGGALSGSSSQLASAGVATFGNLSIDKVGSYTLGASGGGFTAPASNSFSITLGPATQLVFSTQPSSTATAGVAFAQQPVVSVQDAGGNVVTTDNATSVTLGFTGGDSSAVLSCATNPATVSNGVATFAGCLISKGSVTPYQITASGSTAGTVGPFPSTNVTVS